MVDPPAYFSRADYANSPLPQRSCVLPDPSNPGQQVPVIDPRTNSPVACYGNLECGGYTDASGNVATCTGPVAPATGMRKFVDTLPDLVLAKREACPAGLVGPEGDCYTIKLKEVTWQAPACPVGGIGGRVRRHVRLPSSSGTASTRPNAMFPSAILA